MPKVNKPDMLNASRSNSVIKKNQSFLNNYKTGSHKILDLDILNSSDTNLVYLAPRTTIDKDTAYVIWIKGKIYEIPVQSAFGSYWKLNSSASSPSASGIDMTNRIGYRLDGAAAAFAMNDLLNIWAFANDAGTEFAGFGYTTTPQSVFTGVASGTRESLCTLSGLFESSHSFAIGSTVVVLRTTGLSFPHEWNWGTVVDIPSDTTLTVQLYPTLDIENNDLTTGPGFVRQMDRYFPWNGRTDTSDVDDRIYKPNYRLVGQVTFNSGGQFVYSRKSDDLWNKIAYSFSHSTFVRARIIQSIATTTVTRIPLARFLPLWTSEMILSILITRDGWTVETQINNVFGATSQIEWLNYDNYAPVRQWYQIPLTLNQAMKIDTTVITTGAGGTAQVSLYCTGYNDGGLTEL